MNVFRMRSAQETATVQTSLGHSIVIVPLGLQVRLPALYSTDDEPSYELEFCPTRKKSSHLSFFFIFSSDMLES